MERPIVIDLNDLDKLKKMDTKLRILIEYVGEIKRNYNDDYFISLFESIVYQQITVTAGNSIYNKIKHYIGEITPLNINEADELLLRSAGLSQGKISYVKDLARCTLDNKLAFDNYHAMSNQEIINDLTKVKGIGIWSAEMFLIFSLNRKDVFSYNDLGLKKGFKWLFKFKKEPNDKEVRKIIANFKGLETLLSFYLWEISTLKLFKYDIFDLENDVCYLDSKLGLLEVMTKDNRLVKINYVKKQVIKSNETSFGNKVLDELREYFDNKRTVFTVPLAQSGTVFQKKVWHELSKIPFGETISYLELANRIGNSKAVRAVGGALNSNSIPIIIPCHRVIGKDGSLTGYEGGINIKRKLLNHEKKVIIK